jgi:hypothetical protein
LFITLALAVTLLVLLFARDVSRSAHGAVAPRRSENLSFAALANSLLVQRPRLSHDVNDTLGTLTDERVAAYQTLLGEVARTLELPWSTRPLEPVTNPAATLLETSTSWNADRFALRKEPGHVRLEAMSASSAKYFAAHGVSLLTRSPSLALVRAVSIDAVRVNPAALPAQANVMLLPPVRRVLLGVSVLNASYDDQPVTVTITVTPLNHRGVAFSNA